CELALELLHFELDKALFQSQSENFLLSNQLLLLLSFFIFLSIFQRLQAKSSLQQKQTGQASEPALLFYL
ncbi:hypothetical protein, partial [Mycobacterium tuberculosis]|uniref:hypothetical protein n=1 Tax=Mycobacterium tuberculosis TaxID=1773 RepID=UPI001BE11BA0